MIKNLLSNELFLLLAAALLGAFIGWFLRRIFALKDAAVREADAQSRLQGRDRYISQLKLELKEAEEGIALQNSALQQSLEEHAVEVREQKELANDYLVRTRAAESKLINLQRNYLVFKTHKQREVKQLKNSLAKLTPEQESLTQQLQELQENEAPVDMDATLELDTEMRSEQDPYILRNALVSEKRKVEQLLLVKKELSDTFFKFAEEKQRWIHEKTNLEEKIARLEHDKQQLGEQEAIAREIMQGEYSS